MNATITLDNGNIYLIEISMVSPDGWTWTVYQTFTMDCYGSTETTWHDKLYTGITTTRHDAMVTATAVLESLNPLS